MIVVQQTASQKSLLGAKIRMHGSHFNKKLNREMKSILLIEDNNHLSKLYHDALIDEGYVVYVERFPNFDTMIFEKIELVLIDINVFKLATLALLLYIKSINPSLHIVALYEPPFQKYEFLQEYVDYFVIKSGNLSELIDIIHKYFENIQFQNAS